MKITKIALAAILAASFFSISCKEKTAEAQTSVSASVSKAAKNAKPNPESDFEYKFNKNLTEAKITGYIGKSTKIVIPETIQGLPVIRVESLRGGDMDYDDWPVRKATLCVIPNSVKYAKIDDLGTSNKKPSELVLPEGLISLSIGSANISSLNLPSTLKYLSGTGNAKSLVLPESIEGISYFGGLDTLTFPTHPTYGKIFLIDNYSHDGYVFDGLPQINLPENPAETFRYTYWDSIWDWQENKNKTKNLREVIHGDKIDNSVEFQKKLNIEISYPKGDELLNFLNDSGYGEVE